VDGEAHGGEDEAMRGAPQRPLISRLERFEAVESTQSIVRAWLEVGTPEVAIARADVQRAGRGRHGRVWLSPPGAALLLSVGFRPVGLALRHAWRLGAAVALAMADATEAQGLADGTIRLKWPNDLVADGPDGEPRKLAGVLGEIEGGEPGECGWAVIGIGVNVDWSARDFPPEYADSMTSLRELLHRAADRDALFDDFVARLEPRYLELLAGRFDAAGWSGRQRTTGAELEILAGQERIRGRGLGVDPESGALLVATGAGTRRIDSGEVVHCRIRGPQAGGNRQG
jgi:BirA family transcriptional regulator, biotin operon repressor / biotin---[acetyl-CoA-carboxylase] ligase